MLSSTRCFSISSRSKKKVRPFGLLNITWMRDNTNTPSQKDWSAFYASGPEIRQHFQEIVDKYKLMRYIRLEHEVVHAQYDAPTGNGVYACGGRTQRQGPWKSSKTAETSS